MLSDKKVVNVKAVNSRKHSFELEKSTVGGHTFCYLKKNGNVILSCTPKEMMKLKLLFEN
mgnify:CR=1 FL=1